MRFTYSLLILALAPACLSAPYVQRSNLAPSAGFEKPVYSKREGLERWGWRTLGEVSAAGGAIRVATDASYHSGERALIADGLPGSIGVQTLPIRLTPDVETCWASAWIGGPGAAAARPLLLWYGARERNTVELKRDVGAPVERGEAWRRIALDDVRRPTEATHVAFGVIVDEVTGTTPASIVVDDVRIHVGVRPSVRVSVNQAGYDPLGGKPVVVISNFPLGPESEAGFLPPRHLEVVNAVTDQPVYQASLGDLQSVPEWEVWTVSGNAYPYQEEGVFYARVEVAGEVCRSATFQIGRKLLEGPIGAAAIDFFAAQRCGMEIPESRYPFAGHPPCHLDDAVTPQGESLQAIGGWHDGGDCVKRTRNTVDACIALLMALSERADLFAELDRNRDGVSDVLEEARWGFDYLRRIYDPERNGFWNQISGTWDWLPVHLETDNLPGTGDERRLEGAPGTWNYGEQQYVRALAILGRVDPGSGGLDEAIRLERQMGTDTLGYLELWRATDDAYYHNHVSARVEEALRNQLSDGTLPDVEAVIRYALLYPGDARMTQIRQAVTRHILMLRASCPGPFHVWKPKGAEGELVFCPAYDDPDAWYTGGNDATIQTAIVSMLAARLGIEGALDVAQSQVNWMLGLNLYGVSMVEGVGEGIPRYYHRLNLREDNPRGAVLGAVVRGMVRVSPHLDRPWLDLAASSNVEWRTNEPTLALSARWLLFLSTLPQ